VPWLKREKKKNKEGNKRTERDGGGEENEYVGRCHHGMARPLVSDGGDGLQIWKVAMNILKLSRTADKRWSSSLRVGRGANNASP
jgi:hypothetical protein